jgi:hypothetical protein
VFESGDVKGAVKDAEPAVKDAELKPVEDMSRDKPAEPEPAVKDV